MSTFKLIFYLLPFCAVICFPNPSEDYPFQSVLKGPDIYRLFWKNEGDSITFEVQVKTKGWVGFGISPNGGMTGSDIFTAWIQDGKVIYHDRHALGFFRPVIDKLQDWNLIFGKEINNYSVYKFSRKHKTCDLEEDREIKIGTTRIIWSYNPDKPSSEEEDIFYHGFSNRGTASFNLLNVNLHKSREELLQGAFSLDLTVKDYVVPHNTHTTYACSFFSLDQFTSKHHIIAGEPILNGTGTSKLHHLLVYTCDPKAANINSFLQKTFDCFEPKTRAMSSKCNRPIGGWAVGGSTFYFSDDVGLPIGGDGRVILMTEHHYDNSDFQVDATENSGYRLWYTTDLRQYDASILAAGVAVTPFQIIPPNEKSFTSVGHCSAACLNEAFEASNLEEVKVISYLGHSHLAGIRIRIRIFRGDTEIEPIGIEETYDFNFQDFVNFENPRVLKKGDRIVVECDYNTVNRLKETIGGYATQEEMCIGFLIVYPNLLLRSCYSIPSLNQFLSLYDDPIKRITDWSNPQKRKIAQEIAFSDNIVQLCTGSNGSFKSNKKTLKVPFVKNLYTKINTCNRFPTPSEKFPHYAVLKGPDFYKVFWKVVGSVITFEIHVKTKGWAGFGISPNGNMIGSDVIMTWMGENGIRFDDRHVVGYIEPLVDTVQNWKLITGRRYGDYLIVKFSRELDTCDVDDIPIGQGTSRLVWSFKDEKVVSDEVFYHGFATRGTKSVHLLKEESDDRDEKPIEGAFPIDFKISNFSIPHTVDTFYRCEIFKFPDLDKKHHIVAVEPIIDQRNPTVPHHLLLYACDKHRVNITDEEVGNGYECYNNKNNFGGRYDLCESLLFAWAVGGERQYFPDNVGYPIGSEIDMKYLRLEIHYDNPSFKNDIVDNSGLRLWVTEQIRQYDASSNMIGHYVSELQIIPGSTPSFTSFGSCPSQCLSEAMEKENIEEITIFSVMLHGHLLTKSVKLRHFRGGIELEPLAEDKSYDFNFQTFITLKKPRRLRKGDWLTVECVYDSSEKEEVTRGGFGTNEEMCLAFVTSYPSIPLSMCATGPQISEITKLLGDLKNVTWTPEVIEQHQINVKTPKVATVCSGGMLFSSSRKHITLPSITKEYLPLNSTCQIDDDQD